jgi:hypothetical protein
LTDDVASKFRKLLLAVLYSNCRKAATPLCFRQLILTSVSTAVRRSMHRHTHEDLKYIWGYAHASIELYPTINYVGTGLTVKYLRRFGILALCSTWDCSMLDLSRPCFPLKRPRTRPCAPHPLFVIISVLCPVSWACSALSPKKGP